VLAIHPFLALGAAEVFISNGDNGLMVALRNGDRPEIWIPAPWLVFTVEGLLVSVALVAITIWMLRPSEARSNRLAGGRRAWQRTAKPQEPLQQPPSTERSS